MFNTKIMIFSAVAILMLVFTYQQVYAAHQSEPLPDGYTYVKSGCANLATYEVGLAAAQAEGNIKPLFVALNTAEAEKSPMCIRLMSSLPLEVVDKAALVVTFGNFEINIIETSLLGKPFFTHFVKELPPAM